MSNLSIVQSRYTCKAYDPTKRIDDATLDHILQALRLAPSSINIQPWQFLVAANDDTKAITASSMTGSDAHNAPKVLNASHTIILCTRTQLDDDHLDKVLDAESRAGRFRTPDSKTARQNLCQNYLSEYAKTPAKLSQWAEQQTFIALGYLLLVAELGGVQATPIGGFDQNLLNDALNLNSQNLNASVVVTLGYASDDDFNQTLPKARLDFDEVIRFI